MVDLASEPQLGAGVRYARTWPCFQEKRLGYDELL